VRKWLIGILGGFTQKYIQDIARERDVAILRSRFLEGQIQGLSTRAEISSEITAGILNGKYSDAESLGVMFAGQPDDFQAEFFNGAGKFWKTFKPTSETSNSNEFAQDMQVHYIWLLLDDDGRALVRRFAEQSNEVSQ
jgi:hypothetical protein